MILTYEITATLAPELVSRYEDYMRRHHIPALLATGCFKAARFSRAAPGEYRMRYEAPDRATLERYLAEHAPGLRAEFDAEFPSGVALTRTIWETIQEWS
ncbi:MAG: DUF4286 family protein [Gemmatimonadales bacterium]|nr:DUF4286 family protein [Gemmatimonadales bacterium]